MMNFIPRNLWRIWLVHLSRCPFKACHRGTQVRSYKAHARECLPSIVVPAHMEASKLFVPGRYSLSSASFLEICSCVPWCQHTSSYKPQIWFSSYLLCVDSTKTTKPRKGIKQIKALFSSDLKIVTKGVLNVYKSCVHFHSVQYPLVQEVSFK